MIAYQKRKLEWTLLSRFLLT
uniref:Uncharacterized protein n=1 Tax=Rhizophora mucronata TaxID=61149 RepID=A0A2P2IJ88_RHIMU